MSQPTDAEFESIIHSDETHIAQLESEDAKQLRSDLEPAHAVEIDAPGELPSHSLG